MPRVKRGVTAHRRHKNIEASQRLLRCPIKSFSGR